MNAPLLRKVANRIKPMVFTVDPEVDAAYLKFYDGKSVLTYGIEFKNRLIKVDYDQKGNVLGIELIGFKIRKKS